MVSRTLDNDARRCDSTETKISVVREGLNWQHGISCGLTRRRSTTITRRTCGLDCLPEKFSFTNSFTYEQRLVTMETELSEYLKTQITKLEVYRNFGTKNIKTILCFL